MDGRDPADYCERVEPSPQGGRKMAQLGLELLARAGKLPCGFIHVPSTPEMVADALRKGALAEPEKAASMGLRLQLAAIRIALGEIAKKALK